MKNNSLCFLACILILPATKCAKILGIFSAPGYSQYSIGESLLKALAQKGHEVSVISQFEAKGVKNYKNILVENKEQILSSDTLLEMRNFNIFKNLDLCYAYGQDITEKTLADPNVQKLINSNETFDLVIAEIVYYEGVFAFAAHFNAKLIVVNTMGLTEYAGYVVGNPIPTSYIPTMLSGYPCHMNFYERARNTVAYLYDAYKRRFVNYPIQQRLINKYFPKKYDLEDVISKIDLLLLNSHSSVTEAVPLNHAAKEIGGFFVKEPKPLPEDIKKFLDGANKGAILFAMGSNIKTADIPKPILESITQNFSQLEQNVLWKFEATHLNKPNNVMISKWLPQADILAHPNLVAFISHGGLLSIMESLYQGVPIIGVPIFADQLMNVRRLVEYGCGIYLPLEKLGDGSLFAAVTEVLNNPKYKENAVKRSKLLRDRLVPPMEEAIYWVEYVLKHNDTSHLRSARLDLYWYQIYLLDVFGVFIAILVAVAFTIRSILKTVFSSSISPVKTKKKNI